MVRRVFLLRISSVALRLARLLRTAGPGLILLFLLAEVYCSGPGYRPVDLTVPGAPRDIPAQLIGEVGSVFGDPLPGATVTADGVGAGAVAITDPRGRFALDVSRPGPVRLRVEASGHRPVVRDLNLEPGVNGVVVRHEQGLWPLGFAVDFHAFYQTGSPGEAKLFAQVALGNGGPAEVLVLDLTLADPMGQALKDFLDTAEDFRNLAGSYGDANYSEDPRPAVILRPQALYRLELLPLDLPVKDGEYLLEVEVASSKQAVQKGLSQRYQMRSRAVPDSDFDPHTP